MRALKVVVKVYSMICRARSRQAPANRILSVTLIPNSRINFHVVEVVSKMKLCNWAQHTSSVARRHSLETFAKIIIRLSARAHGKVHLQFAEKYKYRLIVEAGMRRSRGHPVLRSSKFKLPPHIFEPIYEYV